MPGEMHSSHAILQHQVLSQTAGYHRCSPSNLKSWLCIGTYNMTADQSTEHIQASVYLSISISKIADVFPAGYFGCAQVGAATASI